MKLLLLSLLSLLILVTSSLARTCDYISVSEDFIYLEFTDFEVTSKQQIHFNNIKEIYFNKINNKIISIKSPYLICEIIEDDVNIFKKWYFE